MSFDGNGQFNILYGSNKWQTDRDNGTPIQAATHDARDEDTANGFNLCVTRDGQGKMETNFLPDTTNSYAVGSSSATWTNLHLSTGLLLYNGANAVTIAASSSAVTPYTVRMPAAQGANNTFLRNDGSGNTTWSSGTGAFNLISTTSLSGASVDIACPGATYQVFQMEFDRILTNSSDTIRLQASVNSGSSYQGTTGNKFTNNGSALTASTATPLDLCTTTSGAGNEAFGWAKIYANGSGASEQPRLKSCFTDSSLLDSFCSARFSTGTGALTHIKVLSGSGNTLSGTVRLYGLSNS